MKIYYNDLEGAKVRFIDVESTQLVEVKAGRVRVKNGYQLYWLCKKDAVQALKSYYERRIEHYHKKLKRLK